MKRSWPTKDFADVLVVVTAALVGYVMNLT